MPLICLVRHGQASVSARDYDLLSSLGRAQASVVGQELARRGLRDPHLVSGTLARQRDTARIAAEAAGFEGPIHQDARWNEYDHLALLGRYAPPSSKELSVQDLLDHALAAWMQDPESAAGGTWTAFAQGARAALAELPAALGRGRDAVVFTSAGLLAALCGALLSLPPEGVVALNRVAVNASTTTLVVGGSGTTLLTFNEHAYFTGARRHMLTYR
ncbi:histidine phosphatase family protein (plasmid) [Streptomyces sp. WAC00288]|uniref:histidine phosphatase family protein n=1 Tax=unclassified Streptomyces TaxID=2593676 RepID=UPI000787E327|nr:MULTISPECIES: histidine phosphatase family protein [unclassified Streptomyces]AVI00200.1 histidine phosphatase family protein [Streptomyces sp. WAC00288]KYG51080.1 histidine phosphatase family protein [Streptomyces sp. WAC04657]